MLKKLILFLLISLTSVISYAEGSGININLNNIDIRVEFKDDGEKDQITGMQYIREPSGLLFDLISIIQKNKNKILKVEQEIYVDADKINKSLSIYLRKEPEGYIVKNKNISHLDKNVLLKGICKALKINSCVIPNKGDETYFFRSNLNLSNKSTDLIEFGCFPCRNDRTYSLTNRFTSKTPNAQTPTFTKTTINRQTIYHYFNKLM